jgi:endonuclease/exonuclease/phosphatase family metal-dependent hydrolase
MTRGINEITLSDEVEKGKRGIFLTRVLTYNILLGGTGRIDQLARMISFSQADVIGMVEATDPNVIEELAQRLDMQCRMTGRGTYQRDWQSAVLSRLPIVHTQLHTRPDIFYRQHLLEVGLQEPDGTQFSVFVIHQPAGYRSRQGSSQIRRAEIQEILSIMSKRQGSPHLLLGDFNSIAPGDQLHGSDLILHFLQEHERNLQNHPERRTSMSKSRQLRDCAINSALRLLLGTRGGRKLIDHAGQTFGRGGIDLLLQAGYKDSFRYLHPKDLGFTFSAACPACRIDYIFVSPELAKRLTASTVISNLPDMNVDEASDHLPVYIDFTA